jgi:hypothetical protein
VNLSARPGVDLGHPARLFLAVAASSKLPHMSFPDPIVAVPRRKSEAPGPSPNSLLPWWVLTLASLPGSLAELLHLEAAAQADHLASLADAAPQDLLETSLGSRGTGALPS